MTFGDRLKQARLTKGLLQTELAELVNISSPMLNQVERGSRNATAPLIKQLAIALEVSANWLVMGDDES